MSERGLVAMFTNCSDPAREGEFRRWYVETHIPDVLATPGMAEAQMYENIAPKEGEARYVALYQTEGDPGRVVADLMSRMPQLAAQGRLIDYLSIVSMKTFRAEG
jgi:hypothetical protein